MRSPKAEPGRRPKRVTRAMGRAGNGVSGGALIVAAIAEATEIVRSEGLESKQLTIRTDELPPTLPSYRPVDVKRVRELLGASQTVLAAFLVVNVNTVRSCEHGKRLPKPVASRFLSEIVTNIAYWRQ
jgi:DNA-binding transcriptional regulator YiaG